MKILFTGATGVLGRHAVPALTAAGHDVTGVCRSDAGRARLEEHGAVPISIDLFDRRAVRDTVAGHHAVIHFATSIPPLAKMRKKSAWQTNDRLRTEATSNLVTAAIDHGVETFIQESVTLVYADGGDRWLDEESRIDPPAPLVTSALEAEQLVADFNAAGGRGIALRLSRLYGPGKASAELVASVASRGAPIIGSGDNYVSSLHSEDAGTAVTAVLTAPAGVYNVTDDDPVTARAYVESLADTLDAPEPRRVPRLVAKIALGSMLPVLTVSQRVSNRRLKETTGWRPRYPSVVAGWESVVAGSAAESA